ncbi:AT-hook motif nuclear-localized protein 14 [Cicer arietinum]|uniref:AT-hook motif nuclear-localized protein n=1 Tax=Cicer arietinum TaxID=3827 RepID=A0A3Q7X8E6_CICAR|nr:AT-hook motif nuclear-localized protein 14 [Cicer arietinum]
MEDNNDNNNQVTTSLFEFEQQSKTPVTVTVNASPVNGLLDGSHTDPHSVTANKKKRGRPRKYESPEEALAARKAAAKTSSFSSPNNPKKFHSNSLGNSREGFNLHIVTVAPGEDVGQKIMSLMQKNSRCEMCILSASGSVSSATLRQPATSGGNITYEGRFDIISLTGSYVHNELEGRSGGLSVCLSHSDGQLIGGSIAGPLKAADSVQVIVGTFSISPKNTGAGIKGDVSTSKLPSPVGEPASSLGFRSSADTANGNTTPGNKEHQTIGGSHFMLQQHGVHMAPFNPSDWGSRPDSRNVAFELIGRTGHGAQQSPENGDYS